VQNRQLRTWLAEDAYRRFADYWENTTELRKTLLSKPSDLVEYEARLKKAIMLYNRAETASRRRNPTSKRLHEKAQAAFEKALLWLEEAIGQDPSLTMWLDRHCDFSANGDLSLDPVGMPRVITSRSLDNQSSGVSAMVKSKRDCKIAAIEDEIDLIKNPPQQTEGEKLAELFRNLKRSRGIR
jgi:hypothetical protein